MMFMVQMQVTKPFGMDDDVWSSLLEKERAYSQAYQQDGTWQHLWRVAGKFANVSIIEADSAEALHEILTGLPLFPFIEMEITALCQHPNAIAR